MVRTDGGGSLENNRLRCGSALLTILADGDSRPVHGDGWAATAGPLSRPHVDRVSLRDHPRCAAAAMNASSSTRLLRPSKVDQCAYSDFVCEIVDRRVIDTLLSLTGRMWRGRLAVGWILTGPEQEHIRIRSKAYNAIDGGP